MSRTAVSPVVREAIGLNRTRPDLSPERKGSSLRYGALVGEPPVHLTTAESVVWCEISRDAWWLRATDRMTLELLCSLMARQRGDGEPLIAAELSALLKLLSRLGLTPLDRRAASEGEAPEDATPAATKSSHFDW